MNRWARIPEQCFSVFVLFFVFLFCGGFHVSFPAENAEKLNNKRAAGTRHGFNEKVLDIPRAQS